jgi:general nucleoside transport system permease protein
MSHVTLLRLYRSHVLPAISSFVRVAAALAISGLLTVILIRLVGGNVPVALRSLWDGAFGSPYNLGTTFSAATPLLLTGLGVGIAFRCRTWNIGGEGQFLVGCLACSAIAVNCPWTRNLSAPYLLTASLAASTMAGAAWSGIAGLLKTWRSVPEVISTIMLNFIAFELLSYMVNGPMQRPDHSQPETQMLGQTATLPQLHTLAPSVFAPSPLHLGSVLAIAMLLVTELLLNKTTTGFAMKIVGANPDAAKLCGINVNRTLLTAILLSGAFCGFAGGVELCGRIGFIYEGYQPGFGFEAIAVALIGKLSPVGILLSSIFIGSLSVGCQSMERTAGIAHETGLVIQAIALFVLLATQSSDAIIGNIGRFSRSHKAAVGN